MLPGPKILIKGIKEMWFVGEMNSIDADKLLKGCDNGTFLVRLNNNRNYVLSVVNKVSGKLYGSVVLKFLVY